MAHYQVSCCSLVSLATKPKFWEFHQALDHIQCALSQWFSKTIVTHCYLPEHHTPVTCIPHFQIFIIFYTSTNHWGEGCVCVCVCVCVYIQVSQEECARLRESVPYVKLYRYNPKHLCPKLNGYGDNAQRKVWASLVSTYCMPSVTSYLSNAPARQLDMVMQWPWRVRYSTVALTSQDNRSAVACIKYLKV